MQPPEINTGKFEFVMNFPSPTAQILSAMGDSVKANSHGPGVLLLSGRADLQAPQQRADSEL